MIKVKKRIVNKGNQSNANHLSDDEESYSVVFGVVERREAPVMNSVSGCDGEEGESERASKKHCKSKTVFDSTSATRIPNRTSIIFVWGQKHTYFSSWKNNLRAFGVRWRVFVEELLLGEVARNGGWITANSNNNHNELCLYYVYSTTAPNNSNNYTMLFSHAQDSSLSLFQE